MYVNTLLDAYKKAKSYTQDKQIAADLNLPKQRISEMRSGRRYVSDEEAVFLAEQAGIDIKEALLGIHADRNENPNIKAIWDDMLKKYKSCGYILQSLAVWAFAATAITTLKCAQCILC
ncbi:DUF3693 domain-containing protein [Plesiomonas shigelloides]|uniref:DUF3693 domain-containing protein n=1 Tax=Plesiomonas shigelloides TaxID=703 RepID=UPI00351CEA12